MQNWENFLYLPWHVDCNPLPLVERVKFNVDQEGPSPHRYVRVNDSEIICALYKNKLINYNDFEMLRHSHRDAIYICNSKFVDGDTSNCAIEFIISEKKFFFTLKIAQL